MQKILCKRFAKELLKSYKFKINQKEKFMNFIHFSRVTKILLSLSLVISLGCDDDRKSTNKQPQPQTATRQNPLQSGEDRSNSEVSQPTTSLSETQLDAIQSILSHLNLRDLNQLKDNVANFIALQPIFRQFQSKGTPSCESEITAIHDRLLVSIDNISPDRINIEDWSHEDKHSYNMATQEMYDSFQDIFVESKRKWQLCSAQRILKQTSQELPLYPNRQEFVNFLEDTMEFFNSEVFTHSNTLCQENARQHFNTGQSYSSYDGNITYPFSVLFSETRTTKASGKAYINDVITLNDFKAKFDQIKDEWKSCNYNRLWNHHLWDDIDRFTESSDLMIINYLSEEKILVLLDIRRKIIVYNRKNMECINHLYIELDHVRNIREEVPSIEEVKERLNPVCEIRD